MKRLPLGIQSFRKIIEGDCVYVDKTKYVYDLLNEAKYYFLSRPRRFGKSLLLDTIAEAFGGDKELFKGLWIYDSDFAFEKHPVIRLDMSRIANDTPGVLKESISLALKERIKEEGFDIDGDQPSYLFQHLIIGLSKKYSQRVVVLIDEYDKPILDHLLDVEKAEANRAVMWGFCGVLKSMDPYLRLTLITGVSKFMNASIFSGLNNLLDITMMEEYANICGIPVEDLDRYFGEHIAHLAMREDFSRFENLRGEILAWYDGYSWDGKNRVINPYSLLSFFMQESFECFWYADGSPKFLIDLIKKNPEIYATVNDFRMSTWTLDSSDIHKIGVLSLFFQTGFLTVKEVQRGMGPHVYHLAAPNREVREAFSLNVIAEFTEQWEEVAESAYKKIEA